MQRSDEWGGPLELAACQQKRGVNIWIYKAMGGGRYERTTVYGSQYATRQTVHLLFNGSHYDVLEVDEEALPKEARGNGSDGSDSESRGSDGGTQGGGENGGENDGMQDGTQGGAKEAGEGEAGAGEGEASGETGQRQGDVSTSPPEAARLSRSHSRRQPVDSDKPERVTWSRFEDETILLSVQDLGHRWNRIADRLPGRTEHAIRNRFARLQSLATRGKAIMLSSGQGMPLGIQLVPQ